METDELRTIVAGHGSTRAFATALKVSQRTVQYWLAGKRRIRPVIEDRIRSLPDNPTLRSEHANKQKER